MRSEQRGKNKAFQTRLFIYSYSWPPAESVGSENRHLLLYTNTESEKRKRERERERERKREREKERKRERERERERESL